MCSAVLERPDVQRNAELERLADLSYSAQYDRLFQKDLDTKTVKPFSCVANFIRFREGQVPLRLLQELTICVLY